MQENDGGYGDDVVSQIHTLLGDDESLSLEMRIMIAERINNLSHHWLIALRGLRNILANSGECDE